MQITDPIADLLTRIRNASTAKHPSVEIPASNMKKAICQILVDEGYIKGMQVKNDTVGLGTAIISTSKGIMTDKAARAAHVGGEVLAYVW